MYRRSFLSSSAVAISSPFYAMAQPSPVPDYYFLYVGGERTTGMLANCSVLEAEVARLKSIADRALKSRLEAGAEFRLKVLAERDKIATALAAGKKDLDLKNVKLSFDKYGAALGAALAAIAFAFSTPVVVGTAIAVSIISGPALLVAQGYVLASKKSEIQPDLVFGYTKERTVMLTGLAEEYAQSSGGKLFGGLMSAVGTYFSIQSVFDSKNDVDQAVIKIKVLSRELESFLKTINSFGPNDAAWAAALNRAATAGASSLQGYIDRTRVRNCLLDNGPILRRP